MNDHFWTAKDIGINSISGILTNSASNSHPFANLPQVPVCLIRRVKKEEFDPYLKSVNLDRFQYNQQMGVIEGTPQLGLTNNDPDIIRLEKLLYNKPLLKPDKHHSNNIPGIDTVPAYFFNQNFSTSDPETFLKVCENVDPSVTSSPEKVSLFQSQNTAQQEKLSHFLDTIEIHLIREISRRSTSFFSALSNLQTLSLETQSCVSQIQSLRDSIKNVEKIAFRNGLNIIQLKRRRGNVEGLYGAVRLISEIIQTQPTINTLVEEGDFVGALDLIGDSTKLLHGVSTQSDDSVTEMLTTNIKLVKYSSLVPKSLDLRGIKSLSNLNTKMGTVSKNIGDLMEAEFCNVLMNHIDSIIKLVPDVRQFEPSKRHEIVFPLENSPVVEFVRNLVLEKFSLGRLTTLNSSLIDTDLENRLNPIVLGLLRIDKLGNALSNYKEMLSAGIKTLSKMVFLNNLVLSCF